MSRTSTESRRRSDARFRRALGLTIAVLIALCGLFLGLGYLQGPKLSSAQVDVAAVIDKSGQQLRLFANQAVAKVSAEQVTITPSAPFSVSTSGDIVAVQFDGRLLYATEYEVSVQGVTSPFGGSEGTLSYSFTTGSSVLYYLHRGEPQDQIVRTDSAGTDRETVYAAPGIQHFVSLGKTLLVSSAEDEASALDLVSLTEAGITQRLILPVAGYIDQLAAASSGTVAGFTISDGGSAAGTPLYWIDLEASGGARPVIGLDGSPVRALDWRFVPGSLGMLVLSSDRTLLLVDPSTQAVLPLGQYQGLLDISSDGATALVTDAGGALALTLATGDEARIELAPVDAEQQAFLGSMAMLPGGTVIAKAVLAPSYATVMLRADGTATTVLYRTLDDAGSIQDFSVSPNGQYVAIETVPNTAAGTSDGRAVDARATSTTTVLVEASSGAVVATLPGFSLAW